MSRRTPLIGYLAADAVSLTGTRVSMIAIPWLVLTTTGSATQTGLVAFAEMAPLVALKAGAGPLVDRVGARRIAITCDVLSVVAVGLVPLLHLAGLLSLPALLGLVAVAGGLRGPGDGAKSAFVPALATHARVPLERVTGLAGAIERTAGFLGAAFAGGLVALLGPANALFVDAGSFAACALVFGLSTRGMTAERVEQAPAGTSYAAELREGWNFLRHDTVLLSISGMVAITNLLDQAAAAVLVPVWARDNGHGVAVIGTYFAVASAASIAGAGLAAWLGTRLPRFRTYVLAFLICGAPRFVAFALGLPLGAVLVVAAVGGLASGFLNPILGAVIYERIPVAMMGRVSSLNTALCWSLIPLGGLLGGLLISAVGLGPALLVVGGAYLVTTMAPPAFPGFRQFDQRPVGVAEDAPENDAGDAAENAAVPHPAG